MCSKEVKRIGFTKLGFSKAGLGCCGHHLICDMGKKECYYTDLDPEVKKYCAAFLRNKNKIKEPSISTIEAKEKQSKYEAEDTIGQLSLF